MNRRHLLYPVRTVLHTLLLLLVLAPVVGAGGCSKEMVPSPTAAMQARYLEALIPLVDQLLSTQITDSNDPDFGALESTK